MEIISLGKLLKFIKVLKSLGVRPILHEIILNVVDEMIRVNEHASGTLIKAFLSDFSNILIRTTLSGLESHSLLLVRFTSLMLLQLIIEVLLKKMHKRCED